MYLALRHGGFACKRPLGAGASWAAPVCPGGRARGGAVENEAHSAFMGRSSSYHRPCDKAPGLKPVC
jgi:hypothetical protein